MPMNFRPILFAAIFTAAALAPGAPSAHASPSPVLVFDIKLPGPVSQISSLNSDSKLLAVEAEPGTQKPARVIAIDKRGRAASIDELASVKEITVPADRLWITGEAEKGAAPDASAPSRTMPVTGVQVYLSGGGEAYAVAYKTTGRYYELRYKDKNGRLLFIATPRDAYGLKSVYISYNGSRVILVDESAMDGEDAADFGQRLYFYNKEGRLTADHDLGDDLDLWLDTSGGVMSKDGSSFASVRGMGPRPGRSVVMFNGDGKVRWEKTFFQTHSLTEAYGGAVGVKGGSGSMLNFINPDGTLKAVERKGYGFDLWLSGDGKYAYIMVFKQFDVKKSGVPEEVMAVFPGAKVVALDLDGLTPEGGTDPDLAIAPDGKAFIHYCTENLGRTDATVLTCYDEAFHNIWDERFYGGPAMPQFVDGSRGFILKIGLPAARLIYYEAR